MKLIVAAKSQRPTAFVPSCLPFGLLPATCRFLGARYMSRNDMSLHCTCMPLTSTRSPCHVQAIEDLDQREWNGRRIDCQRARNVK